MSERHLYRNANEFAGRYNFRDRDMIDPVDLIARRFVGKWFMYKDLVGNHGQIQLEIRTMFHGDELQFLRGMNSGSVNGIITTLDKTLLFPKNLYFTDQFPERSEEEEAAPRLRPYLC